jgi:glycerol uptake facilitator-like aquaporin
MQYLPDIILLIVGLAVMVLLLLLGAMSENWVGPACFLGVAVVYFGWHRTLVNLCCRQAGKDPDDFDRYFPG